MPGAALFFDINYSELGVFDLAVFNGKQRQQGFLLVFLMKHVSQQLMHPITVTFHVK